MLVYFKVKGFACFKDEVTLDMRASSERSKNERLIRWAKTSPRLLPMSALFGSNNSGKTQLIEAIKVFKNIILKPLEQNKPFSINRNVCLNDEEATTFEVEFLIQKKTRAIRYRYHLEINKHHIIKESLLRVFKDSNKVVFEREEQRLKNSEEGYSQILQRTRSNVTLLYKLGDENNKECLKINKWFSNLMFLNQSTRYMGVYDSEKVNEFLKNFDTGISRIEIEYEPVISDGSPTVFEKTVSSGELDVLKQKAGIDPEDKEVEAVYEKLFAVHKFGGVEYKLSIILESLGTHRIIQFYTLLEKLKNGAIVIIDEIDDSLHTAHTKKLIEYLLEPYWEVDKPKGQLIFTAHDTLLMDSDLLRNDEIKILDREENGASLYSVADFKLRQDKSVSKNYLLGRLGGTPRLI